MFEISSASAPVSAVWGLGGAVPSESGLQQVVEKRLCKERERAEAGPGGPEALHSPLCVLCANTQVPSQAQSAGAPGPLLTLMCPTAPSQAAV